MSGFFKSKLPRLPHEFYRGRAMVLWTHTFEDRATGWLDERFHRRFREALLHACGRFSLASACYVLMPDHWHLVWIGLAEESDQTPASVFLRKHLRPFLGAARLQDRAHDHVLRENERERGAFESACAYVLQNPERAKLCEDWREWPYVGAMVCGYPNLDPRTEDFWPDFWKIHNRLVEKNADSVEVVARRGSGGTESEGDAEKIPALPRRATKRTTDS